MTVALPCPTCGGAVAGGRHLDRDRCGAKPYQTVRVTPKQGEAMLDALVREVLNNRKGGKP